MDKLNTHQVTMGIKKSIKQQNSKQKRHIAPKSKEFRSWILRKVIDNGKNNSLNIWILDNPKIWGTHLIRHEVVMPTEYKSPSSLYWNKIWLFKMIWRLKRRSNSKSILIRTATMYVHHPPLPPPSPPPPTLLKPSGDPLWSCISPGFIVRGLQYALNKKMERN